MPTIVQNNNIFVFHKKPDQKMLSSQNKWLCLSLISYLLMEFQKTCLAVFPLSFLSLGQFYKILQNWRDSCAKIISCGWKLAKLSRKSIFFTHSHKICWANFSKCWANFETYGLRGNTAVWWHNETQKYAVAKMFLYKVILISDSDVGLSLR